MSLELSPDAAARTNKAQGAAAEGVAPFLPFVQGWQPLVRLQSVVHAVIHICRTLDHRVESLRRDCPTDLLHWFSSWSRRIFHPASGIVRKTEREEDDSLDSVAYTTVCNGL